MRTFYEPSLWILQHFLLTHLDLHHRLLGLLGLRFNRMVSEDTALYDVMALDSTNHMDSEMIGQIAVIVSQGQEELDLGRYWEVEPLGIAEGTNTFGATLTVPRVRFWRYGD